MTRTARAPATRALDQTVKKGVYYGSGSQGHQREQLCVGHGRLLWPRCRLAAYGANSQPLLRNH